MTKQEGENYLNIVVNGEEIDIDLDDELRIGDIDEDMKTIAVSIAYWGSILASAEEEKVRVDAYYRRWRAQKGESFLEAEPKTSEWKIRQKIESMEQFDVLKTGIARAAKNSLIAKSMFDAFCRKANMLQSKGAMMRHELSADNMSVKIDDEEKRENIKKVFKKKTKGVN